MESELERLVQVLQSKSNDIDVKIDAVAKLQAELETGIEIPDPDAVIAALKTCLRTANQHLTTATVSVLPPALPLLVARPAVGLGASTSTSPGTSTSSVSGAVVDAHVLRHALAAFLPPGGGLLDRLGDARDRVRDKAREALVLLGGFAFRAGGAGAGGAASSLRGRDAKGGPETPLQMFERHMREAGLGSKVPRVREQALRTLVQLRGAHHLFPIRPYLAGLVELLEDGDSGVRDCAKQAVVGLFTGPGVTDAARADLKKEMARKGVRKTIVDGVLARVAAAAAGSTPPLAQSETGSESGDGGAYVPPSVSLMKKSGPLAGSSSTARTPMQSSFKEPSRPASRAAAISPIPTDGSADVKTVYIASSRDLDNEFAGMLKPFEGRESEHNWAARDRAVTRVRGMLKGGAYERFPDSFLHGLKGFIECSLKTLASLRTTVASNTCSLYVELAATLGSAIDPFCEQLYVNLLRMSSLTKKIIAQQSQATVTAIMHSASALPRAVLPNLWNNLQDKAIQTRVYMMGHVKTYMEIHAVRARAAIEAAGGVDTLEKCVRKGLLDPNPGVRDVTRQTYWVFEAVWRDRGRAVLEGLDATGRKQLEKACPDPALLADLPAAAFATPQVKKSSVAAAIAASRAKAKAIATAPPSLRHQATSAARTNASPPAKRAGSPSLSTSSSGGGARPGSPLARAAGGTTPPRPRVLSTGTVPRSVSSGFVPSRDQSRQTQPATPPSPTPEQQQHYRRRVSSSPLALASPVLRRALQTALPASPPAAQTTMLQPALPLRAQGVRESINIAGFHASNEDSLLLASNIPIPEDSDSDMDVDTSVNLISFSTPYEVYPPARGAAAGSAQAPSAGSFSPRSSGSRPAAPPHALSTGTSSPPAGFPQPGVVEDALRARAEQAESAAERLLELVDPEEENPGGSTLPASLLLHDTGPEGTPRRKSQGAPGSAPSARAKVSPALDAPRTPVNTSAAILRKAALFQDSPAYNSKKSASLFAIISGRTHESAWWHKRMSLLEERSPSEAGEPSDHKDELNGYIAALERGTADIRVLRKLALLCVASPVNELISPISPALSAPFSSSPQSGGPRSLLSFNSDLWEQDKAFERLFGALMQYLDPARDVNELEYALIVLWELIEHQAPHLEGREAEVFAALLRVRFCAHASILQATTQFRDALTSRIEPVYGLTVMHGSIRAFRDSPLAALTDLDIKNGTYAFGLIAMGKFILRLPAEVLEDELPRMRATLISALTDQSSDSCLNVREAAAASIIAAQLILRDEGRLFLLLDGLPEDKKNLLTYLFDKHGCHGALGEEHAGIEKLEREMRRLDGRTSTPLRPATDSPFI